MKYTKQETHSLLEKISLVSNNAPLWILKREEMHNVSYTSVVGSLMYAQIFTCLNLVFIVGVLGRYLRYYGMRN